MPLKVYTPPSTNPLTLPYWVLAIAERGVEQLPGSWWAAVLMLSEADAGSARMPMPAAAESNNASRRFNKLLFPDLSFMGTPLFIFFNLRHTSPDHHSPTEPSSWKTRAIGFEPPKGYLLKEASLHSKPRPGLVGRGKRPFTMRIGGNPNHSAHTRSLSPGCTKLQISWIRKFGMAESTCRVARPPMGPSQACGAMETLEMLAIAATFHRPVSPPT